MEDVIDIQWGRDSCRTNRTTALVSVAAIGIIGVMAGTHSLWLLLLTIPFWLIILSTTQLIYVAGLLTGGVVEPVKLLNEIRNEMKYYEQVENYFRRKRGSDSSDNVHTQ